MLPLNIVIIFNIPMEFTQPLTRLERDTIETLIELQCPRGKTHSTTFAHGRGELSVEKEARLPAISGLRTFLKGICWLPKGCEQHGGGKRVRLFRSRKVGGVLDYTNLKVF